MVHQTHLLPVAQTRDSLWQWPYALIACCHQVDDSASRIAAGSTAQITSCACDAYRPLRWWAVLMYQTSCALLCAP